jgi:MYXO-CTERM domain-containing protein
MPIWQDGAARRPGFAILAPAGARAHGRAGATGRTEGETAVARLAPALHNPADMTRRRALLLLGLAGLPAVVLAAISAGLGQVLETTNFDAVNAVSYVNAAQCAGTEPVHLEWNVQAGSTTTGTYKIYASNQQPTAATGTTTVFCAEQDVPNATPTPVVANQVDSATVSSAVQDKDVSGATIASAVQYGCDAANEGKALWICSHLFNDSGTRIAAASGKFLFQVTAPSAPVGVTASAGDSALQVNWSAGTGGATVDHYIVTATPVGSTNVVASSGQITGTSTRLRGLVNGTEYTVSVVAFSKGGNPSAAGTATGTPVPVEDFWSWYKLQGGTEQGGCASGSGGLAALAGVAALLVLRRRRK